jgi:hypothetical protein
MYLEERKPGPDQTRGERGGTIKYEYDDVN